MLRAGARPEIEGGTKDPALTRFWCTLLRPVQQAPIQIHGDADTVVAGRLRGLVTNRRHHQWTQRTTVKVARQHLHALAIAPVQHAGLEVGGELLAGREGPARHDRDAIAPVEIGTF